MSVTLLPLQRLELIRLVNALTGPEFEEILFALKPKDGVVPPNVGAQGNRAKALLEWVEGPTGCGLNIFLTLLDAVAPGQFKLESLSQLDFPSPSNPGSDFTVDLMGEVPLVMVQVPKGVFLMGSPEAELDRYEYESPQHRVAVSAFFMGKYPVTQRQWRLISLLDPVDMPLEHDPSSFKGDDLPTEGVNWHEAVEFCKRLSKHTSNNYRLPSEAEWEYACRAVRDGTSVPFHFGETISPEQANYGCEDTYGKGKEGVWREKTIPVGSFPANGFGLHDMHGNVWEWCEDVWHESYQGAPTDGSAWVDGGNQNRRILRGGSWGNSPGDCRSAYRYYANPDHPKYYLFGFRVCCSSPTTLV